MNSAVAQLVSNWKYGTYEMENEEVSIYLVALYDHDYQYHILVSEHPKHPGLRATPGNSFYSLWFLGGEDVTASLVDAWECATPPFIESAKIVEEWYSLCQSLNSMGD